MSKKDYKSIADVIKSASDNLKAGTLSEPIRYIANKLADIFKDDNDLFDYKRFFIACGLAE